MKSSRLLLLLTSVLILLLTGQRPKPNLDALAQKAVSPIQGDLKIKGLQQTVKIFRDNWGVAHIHAENQHDLFFAQGFSAAQDRLFQMEMWKRSGQGRSAEVLGKSAVERDRYARLLKYRGDMHAEFESYAPDTEEILAAFTDGINAYIRYLKTPGGPGLPVEFQIAGFSPEPWKPEDCLSRMAAYAMTGNAHQELTNSMLLTALGPDKAQQLLQPDPPAKLDPVEGVDYSQLSPQIMKDLVGSDTPIEFPNSAMAIGSNNWTISGKLTSTGKPILANDPHRVMALPSLRYMVHLYAPGWNVIGAGEPALPGVAVGHNERIAWGFTIFPVDQQDLYIEELNPANPNEYKQNGNWRPMRVESATIKVKDASPQTVTLQFTSHGPVLWEDAAHHRALVLHWIGTEPGTAGYLASLSVDRARDWNGFLSALERWKLPPENLVYADVDGNIGEQSAGLTPIRSWTGMLPVPGGEGKFEWSGYVPLAELPRSFNPADGWIATANNRTIPEDYKYKVGFAWTEYRVNRIRDVLSSLGKKQKIRPEDVEALQNDVYSIPADQLIRMLPRHSDGPEARFMEMLKDWDREMKSPSVPAALFEVWERKLRIAVLNQIAGTSDPGALPLISVQHAVEYLKSMPGDTQQHILLSTLADAGHEMEQKQGDDPVLWSWGAMHTITFRHSLDGTRASKALFDLGPVARPGDGDTVDATGGDAGGYQQRAGASYREILDLSDWDNSLAINTPGQSGQPGSRHYSDLLPFWSAGQYFPLVYSKDAIEENSEDVLTLEPEAPSDASVSGKPKTK